MTKKYPGTIAAIFFVLATSIPVVIVQQAGDTSSAQNYATILSFMVYFLLMTLVVNYGAKWLVSRMNKQTLLGVVSPKKNPDQGVLFDEDGVPSV